MPQTIDFLTVQEEHIPVHLYVEKRKNVRFSFTKKGLAIRIPHFLSNKETKEQIRVGKNWGKSVLEENVDLLNRYRGRNYAFGHTIQTFDTVFKVTKHHFAHIKLIDNQLLISKSNLRNLTPQLLSKLFAKKYKPFFQDRVNYWNQLIPVQHNQLRLKYNSSNWGSCSSKRNINLSTRLILCPLEIIDYVIVHELCHLIHPNHSKNFWQEVAAILPDYTMYDKWLKKNGSRIDF